MANLTSPQPEDGILNSQKLAEPLNMSSLQDGLLAPTSNGINGHPSPAATPPESKPAVETVEEDSLNIKTTTSAASLDSDQKQNSAAFDANSAAPSTQPTQETTSELPPASLVTETSKSEEVLPEASKPEASESPAQGLVKATEAAEPLTSQMEIDVDPARDSASKPLDDSLTAAADTAMPDATPLQIKAGEDATGEDSTSKVDASSMDLDAAQPQPSFAISEDASMSDSQTTTKVAREREDDDVEERSAKRAKTAEPEPASTNAAEGQASTADAPSADGASTVKRERPAGPPGSLGDPAEESKPISLFAVKQIKQILGNAKKTKAGSLFKDPVKTKWPQLWDQYAAKISRPVDISQMERGLRDGSYATLGDFVEDVWLLFENALAFNGPVHEVTDYARAVVMENIFPRMAEWPAQEPPKGEKKAAKAAPTRQAEPRAAARRESRGGAASHADDIVAVSAPGQPVIRRNSTRDPETKVVEPDQRPKRPINPPKNKDLGFEVKNLKKKKSSPEYKFCDQVLAELVKNKHYGFNQWFLAPVDVVNVAPDYFKVIKKPMDLGTMKSKLQNGEYESLKDFESDFKLIVKNCHTYNGPEAIITKHVDELDALFQKKWNEKNKFMAQHAPAAAASPATDEDDDEDEEVDGDASEDDAEDAPGVGAAAALVKSYQRRWDEEKARLETLMAKTLPNEAEVKMQTDITNLLMKQLFDAKQALADEQAKKPAAKKSKAAKPKKPAGGGSKKAGAAAGAGGAGSKKAAGGVSKKAAKPRVVGPQEKEVVANGIGELDGTDLERAIVIIKKDTNQEESEEGELELDIEMLSSEAVGKLYDIIVKANPSLKIKETKKANADAKAASHAAPARSATKPKKHKPMGKAEQEHRLEQLRNLKAQFQRPGSGSQEPMQSVEGEGSPPNKNDDSDDDSAEDSEED